MEETLQDICQRLREQILQTAKELKRLMTRDEVTLRDKPAETLSDGMREDAGEMKANIMLAYRHLEDARMRVGKILQAHDGGTSIYDKSAKVEPQQYIIKSSNGYLKEFDPVNGYQPIMTSDIKDAFKFINHPPTDVASQIQILGFSAEVLPYNKSYPTMQPEEIQPRIVNTYTIIINGRAVIWEGSSILFSDLVGKAREHTPEISDNPTVKYISGKGYKAGIFTRKIYQMDIQDGIIFTVVDERKAISNEALTFTINTREIPALDTNDISFEEIVKVAFPEISEERIPYCTVTVGYSNPNRAGKILNSNERIQIEKGIRFNAGFTGNA